MRIVIYMYNMYTCDVYMSYMYIRYTYEYVIHLFCMYVCTPHRHTGTQTHRHIDTHVYSYMCIFTYI